MSDLTRWIDATLPTAAHRAAREQRRAAHAWRRINDKFETVTSVAFKNAAGTTLAAQSVRIEWDNRASLVSGAAGTAGRMNLNVFGVNNHPTRGTVDMKEGYRFVLNNDEYRCTEVIEQLGERQGIFVAI